MRVYFKNRLQAYQGTCDGPIFSNWYCVYMKMMYALPAVETYIDLEAITRAQIEANDLPCRSVKRAVEAGLLEAVPGQT